MIKIDGNITIIGALDPLEVPAHDTDGIVMQCQGRVLVLYGLKREEVRALAPAFMGPVTLTVGSSS